MPGTKRRILGYASLTLAAAFTALFLIAGFSTHTFSSSNGRRATWLTLRYTNLSITTQRHLNADPFGAPTRSREARWSDTFRFERPECYSADIFRTLQDNWSLNTPILVLETYTHDEGFVVNGPLSQAAHDAITRHLSNIRVHRLHAALWPLPLPPLLLAIPLLYSARKARRRATLHLCLKCAYDLRATPPTSPCPECGTPCLSPLVPSP